MPILVTVIIIILGYSLGEIELGLVFGLLAGLHVLRREYLQKIDQLQQEVDWLKQVDTKESATVAPAATEQAEDASFQSEEHFELDMPSETESVDNKAKSRYEQSVIVEDNLQLDEPTEINQNEVTRHSDRFDEFFNKVQQLVVSYFTDGNLFVRVGLLILFFGVAFLLKYAAENSQIPLEFRFLGAAAGGFFLLVMGWRLRNKKELYALLLQGGGIGIIYITIFASYRLADLIPSSLTFVLLVLFSIFSAALAVLQNSRSLAIFAVLGGFLAPFLASSGSGNYVGLFSYYALLNVSIFIIAWFKSWRLLNLLGFVFTFAIYALWVITSYQTQDLYPAIGFLLLFFLMYSVLGILYSLKQEQNLKGLVDGTLVFGTPVIASSLLMAMVRHLEYGIAIAAALMGIYYVTLARWLWNKQGEQLRLMSEAMLAVGVIFATLAIPYSLDGHWTSATWALEAAGILWISLRQNRFYAQWFAIALQFGAGLLFLFRNVDDIGNSVWLNPAFLGGLFIALGAFISARLLYKLDDSQMLRKLHLVFYVWAILWWLGSALIQIDYYIDNSISALLILFVATALALIYVDRVRGWNWTPAAISSVMLLPILSFIALFALVENSHFLVFPDFVFWALALVANYWILVQLESLNWSLKYTLLMHISFIIFVCAFLSYELNWFFYDLLPAMGEGYIAVLTVIPILVLYLSRTSWFPVIKRFGSPMQLGISISMMMILLFWSLAVNLSNSADPAPLPYLPFLNPLDLAHIIFFISVVRTFPILRQNLDQYRDEVLITLGGLMFIWLSAILLRSMHHYADIPFDLSIMLVNVKIQTSLSILWTVIGMLAMLFAARRSLRQLWIAGAVLVAVVLVKMFFIDLGASGTVERIVSFLVVGGLLVAMGYFSPIPEKHDETKDEKTDSKDDSEASHV